MDAKDVLVKVCNEMIETNRHCRDLGRLCERAFNKQYKINNRIGILALVGVIGMVILDNKRKDMQMEIDILKNEVKELKAAKEE